MSDDIFSKLFELFDQPGPINWKLAAEVARHLSGDTEPVEPWTAEEFREIAEVLDIPEGTVKSRMAEALTQLARMLKPTLDEETTNQPQRRERTRQ